VVGDPERAAGWCPSCAASAACCLVRLAVAAARRCDGVRRLLARGDSLAVAAVTGCLLRSVAA
jgi:hypothetical protein